MSYCVILCRSLSGAAICRGICGGLPRRMRRFAAAFIEIVGVNFAAVIAEPNRVDDADDRTDLRSFRRKTTRDRSEQMAVAIARDLGARSEPIGLAPSESQSIGEIRSFANHSGR